MSVNINELATKIGQSGTMSPNKYVVNIHKHGLMPLLASSFFILKIKD